LDIDRRKKSQIKDLFNVESTVRQGGKARESRKDIRRSRQMGIADRVILSGYCRYDRLVAAYRAMDVLVYPVPGTDKS